MGFGAIAIEPESSEPTFHAPWEARVLAITLAVGALGHWTIDRSRFSRESLPPAVYYSSSYYEIWLRSLRNLLLDEGLVSESELREGRAVGDPVPTRRPPLAADRVLDVMFAGSPYHREPASEPKFRPGQDVVTLNDHPTGHTRLPRYARGRFGRIEAVRGVFAYPDALAHGPDAPQWCYTVIFDARELWGSNADPACTISVDAFEPYLRMP